MVKKWKLQPRHTSKKTLTSCVKDLVDHRPPCALETNRDDDCLDEFAGWHKWPYEIWNSLEAKLAAIRDFKGLELKKVA